MANQPETSTWEPGVFQLETSTPVQGGVGGASNTPLLQLASRTKYLYDQITSILSSIAGLAPLNSPTFTGDPKAPAPDPGDNDTSISTTAFVQLTVAGRVAVDCAGGANVTLTQAQWGYAIVRLTGLLTANINVIFPTQATGRNRWLVVNDTTGAFTVTCKTAAGSGVVVTQGKARDLVGDGTNIVQAETELIGDAAGAVNLIQATAVPSASTVDLGAVKGNSVHITGTTTINSLGNSLGSAAKGVFAVIFDGILQLTHGSSLRLPTAANITTAAGDVGLFIYEGSGNWRCIMYQRASGAALSGSGSVDLSGYALLDSPIFVNNPRAPTPAPGDDDTSIATTEWVNDTIAAALASLAANGFGGETTIASASTTNLAAATGRTALITGTTAITSFGSSASTSAPVYLIRFSGALTLTRSSALETPGGISIQTAAGGAALVLYLGSGNWRILGYWGPATAAEIRAGADNSKPVTAKGLRDAQAYIPLTEAATVAWNMNDGFNAKVTLTADRNMGTPTNPADGQDYRLQVIMGGSGGYGLTFPSAFDWGESGTPDMDGAAVGERFFIHLHCYDAATPKFRASIDNP